MSYIRTDPRACRVEARADVATPTLTILIRSPDHNGESGEILLQIYHSGGTE